MPQLKLFPLYSAPSQRFQTPAVLLQRKEQLFPIRKEKLRRPRGGGGRSIRRQIRQREIPFMPDTRHQRHWREPKGPHQLLVIKGGKLILRPPTPNEHGRREIRQGSQYLKSPDHAGNRPRSLNQGGDHIEPASGKTTPRHRHNIPHRRPSRSGNNSHIFRKGRKGALHAGVEKPLFAELLLRHRSRPGLGSLAERKNTPGVKLIGTPGSIDPDTPLHKDFRQDSPLKRTPERTA
jgi:hypothetical protein